MNWSVTYRAKDGKTHVGYFEADNRNALFRLLAEKNISAIRVEEAKNHAQRRRGAGRGYGRVALAAATIAIIVGVVFFAAKHFSGGGDETHPVSKVEKPKKIATVTTPPATNKIATQQKAQGKEAKPIDDGIPPNKKIVEMISVVTNADGSVLERFRTADGKIRSRQTAPKPIFDNASDQALAMAVTGAATGHAMPPMPVMNNADDEFLRSLDKEIVIADDDTDAVKALKRDVIAMREQMKQLMAEGHSFAEVIKEHRDIVNHGVQMRAEATRLLKEFIDNGERDAAVECLDKFNEALRGMGIEEVEMPLTNEERRELIREQHKNSK